MRKLAVVLIDVAAYRKFSRRCRCYPRSPPATSNTPATRRLELGAASSTPASAALALRRPRVAHLRRARPVDAGDRTEELGEQLDADDRGSISR